MPRKNARPAARKERAKLKAKMAQPKPREDRRVIITHGASGASLAMLAASLARFDR